MLFLKIIVYLQILHVRFYKIRFIVDVIGYV